MVLGASQGSGTSILVLGALVVIAVLVRQGRAQSRNADLQRGERMRPLAITCIDPLISLLVIGPLLWRLVSTHGVNLAGALGGAAVGVVIGYFRARVMFVRAEKRSYAVVLKRSGVEYALVFVLIALRSLEGQLELHRASAGSVAVAVIAGLGLVEAFARAAFIVGRYATHRELPADVGPREDPSLPEPEPGPELG